jgi:hypothetical protein
VPRDEVADEAPLEGDATAGDAGIEHDDVGGVLVDGADRRTLGRHRLDHGLHAGGDDGGDLRGFVAVQLGGFEAQRARDLEDLVGQVVPEDADRHDVVGDDGQDRSCHIDVDAAPRCWDEVEANASAPASTAAIASAGRVIPQIFTNTGATLPAPVDGTAPLACTAPADRNTTTEHHHPRPRAPRPHLVSRVTRIHQSAALWARPVVV